VTAATLAAAGSSSGRRAGSVLPYPQSAPIRRLIGPTVIRAMVVVLPAPFHRGARTRGRQGLGTRCLDRSEVSISRPQVRDVDDDLLAQLVGGWRPVLTARC